MALPPAGTPLNPQERLDWLRLIRTDNVGPVTFYHLLRHYGSAAAALASLPELGQRGGQRDLKPFPRAAAERELASLHQAGGRLIAWGEPDYPSLLAELEDAPPLLSVVGQVAMLARPTVAIVGARNASASGQRFAREIAWDLGQRGFLVVSGLARGIDAAAHGGALETGTAAVVGGGVSVVYPAENRALHESIAQQGAVVAEMPWGTIPQARHFPRRNRLISGMSSGVLVIEAALRSGSLITARFAAEQGREVFAVPGSPLDPRCRGTNDLIRNGATLTESADDVVASLGRQAGQQMRETRRGRFGPAPLEPPDATTLAAAQRTVLELLGPTAASIDDIVRASKLAAGTVSLVLLELELAGRIERQAGNRVTLR